MDKSKAEPTAKIVEAPAQKPKAEVRPSANPETSGWDELDKNKDQPVVQVVETIEPKPKPEVRPSANPETSESQDTNQTKQPGLATPSNFLTEIAEQMKKALIIAGRKLEAGEFNDFEKLIRQLASHSEDTENKDLQTNTAELTEMIENAKAHRRSSLLAMQTKIHSLKKLISK